MNEELLNYVKDHIIEIDSNVYEVVGDNEFDFNRMVTILNEMVIKAKEDYVNSGRSLELQDIFLVRINEELPGDLCYKSYSNTGKYLMVENPIVPTIDLKSEEREQLKLVWPIHRDTVHYSLNGLVSDTCNSEFTNRSIVVIEPFVDHISERLININPVDTMIDVSKEDEPIKDNAIFILSKQSFEELSLEQKERISKNKIYIFDPSKFKIDMNARNHNLLTAITDFVLCHNNILPQHSKGQLSLHSEFFCESPDLAIDDSVDDIYHSDKDYLRMFQDLIDKVSISLFGISYYNLTDEIKEKRVSDKSLPGVIHTDTKYYYEEIENNLNNYKEILDKYLEFLFNSLLLPESVMFIIKERIKRFSCNSSADFVYAPQHFAGYEEIKEYINENTMSTLISLTLEFNKNLKENLIISNSREKHE